MKTLIIADTHQDIDWIDGVQADERPDRTVFLGDGPDGPKDSIPKVLKTAGFIRRSLLDPRVVYLMGNHEAAYLLRSVRESFSAQYPHQPRYWKKWKARRYIPALAQLLSNFRIATIEQGWLVSHAGLHPSLVPDGQAITQDWLDQQSQAAFASPDVGPWLKCGDARTSSLALKTGDVGGPLWLDWDEEFQPIDGINQIVGHSRGEEPRWRNTPASRNLNLDTGHHYAVIVDGEVHIRAIPRGQH